MRTYKPGLVDSILAAAALTKFRFIGFDGNLCGAGAKALGIAEVDTAQGQQCPVVIDGIMLLETGAAVTKGTAGKSDATGRGVPATALSVSVPVGAVAVTSTGAQPALTVAGGVLPEIANGYFMDDAAAAGEFVRFRLC